MEQRVSLITLGVADVAASRAFYERLGWTVAMDVQETVFFQIGGSVLTLWSRDKLAEDSGVSDNGGWGGVTLAHNVRSREEVDAIIERARQAGAAITREPAETFYGGYGACSRIRTDIRGRSRTTPGSSWTGTAICGCRTTERFYRPSAPVPAAVVRRSVSPECCFGPPAITVASSM